MSASETAATHKSRNGRQYSGSHVERTFDMMAKMTISFGSVLIVLGIGTFLTAGATNQTALLPTLIGGLLLLTGTGMLAQYERFFRRAMVGATITSAIGLLGAVGALLSRGDLADPVALASKIALAILCAVLLAAYATSLLRPNKTVEPIS